MSEDIFEVNDKGEVEDPEDDGDISGWYEVKGGQPIEEVLVQYLCEEPWKSSKATGERFDPRPECEAFCIRDPKSKAVIYSWKSKGDDRSIGEALSDFISDYLGDDEEPRSEKLWVSRSIMPDGRDWDSSKVFTVANELHIQKQQSDTSGVPALPIPPAVISARPIPSAPQHVGLSGNITADYNAMLNSCFDFMWRVMEVDCQRRENSLRLDMWSLNFVANEMRKSPDAAVRAAEMQHELELKRMEMEQSTKGQAAREVGGIVSDFAGQALQTGAGQQLLAAFAKRMAGGDE